VKKYLIYVLIAALIVAGAIYFLSDVTTDSDVYVDIGDTVLDPIGTTEPTGDIIVCEPEQRGPGVCAEIYQPVCGKVNVQCVTEPCDQVFETFSNSCFACGNSLVESYIEGECVAKQ
jgi:hypothetical protein